MFVNRLFDALHLFRLLISLFIIIILMVVFSVLSYVKLRSGWDILERINADNYAISRMSSEFSSAHSNLYKIISRTNANYAPQKIDFLKKQQLSILNELSKDIKEKIQDNRTDTEEKKLLEELEKQLAKYKQSAVASMDMASVGLSVDTMFIDSNYQTIKQGFYELTRYLQTSGKASREDTFEGFTKRLIVVLAIVLLISVSISILVNKMMNARISGIEAKVLQPGYEDFKVSPNCTSTDAIGLPSQDVTIISRTIQNTIGEIEELQAIGFEVNDKLSKENIKVVHLHCGDLIRLNDKMLCTLDNLETQCRSGGLKAAKLKDRILIS
ncbi:MAG: hypothetical protein HQK89_10660 [Nitrospirae bacterium]|nr:hypothetical protein [Nitrospirota bacterium]